MALKDVVNELSVKMHERSPEILTGLGIAGMAIAIPFTVTGTIKAYKLVQNEKKRRKVTALTKKEIVKLTWKCYVPTAVSATTGAICVIGATSISSRRNAALATAYSLSENALKTYQKKVIETIGEKKEEKIRDEIAKDELKQHPVETSGVYVTRKGTTLFYDAIRNDDFSYYRGDIETHRKIKDKLNNRMYGGEMFISLNEYYSEIGLPPDPRFRDLGWCADNGPIDLKFSVQFADDGITPCVVVTTKPEPRHGYGYEKHLM